MDVFLGAYSCNRGKAGKFKQRSCIICAMSKYQILLLKMWRDLVINCLAASPLIPGRFRRFIYRSYGMTLGRSTFIWPRCFFCNSHFTIGDHCFVNYGCIFDNTEGSISIGDGCFISTQVMFCTPTHEVGPQSRRAGAVAGESIIIGNGCWIGARALILPGVVVGSGSIIGAGSVVTKNCESNGVYCGNPARLIRKLTSD